MHARAPMAMIQLPVGRSTTPSESTAFRSSNTPCRTSKAGPGSPFTPPSSSRTLFITVSRRPYHLVPGGKMISKIVSQTVKDVESENRKVVKEGTDASGKSSFGYHQKGISADSASPANQTPEDVLRFFMMKQFIGTHFLDNLIIPQKGLGKESK